MTHEMVKGAVHFRGLRRETSGLQQIRPAYGDFILTFADDLHDQRLLVLGALLRCPCVPLAYLGAPAHKEVTSLFFFGTSSAAVALGEKMLEEWSIRRCVIGAKNNGFQSTFSESRLLFCTARPGSQRSSIF